MISRLCASFASPHADATTTLRVYLDDTLDIPLPWLREGIARFRDEPGRKFLPSLAEIREACARAIVAARRSARGDPPSTGIPQLELDVAGAISWSREHAPLGYAQAFALESGRRKVREIEVSNARSAATEAGGTRGQGAAGAFAAILAGLRVRGESGAELPIPRLAHQISSVGVHVPSWGDPDKAAACNGYWLATLLAYRLMGREVPQVSRQLDFERADRVMRAHRDRVGAESCAWWFDDLRQVVEPTRPRR